MRDNIFTVILTNGTVENEYYIRALNEEQAIILAQAKAIQQAKGYKLVKCVQNDNY